MGWMQWVSFVVLFNLFVAECILSNRRFANLQGPKKLLRLAEGSNSIRFSPEQDGFPVPRGFTKREAFIWLKSLGKTRKRELKIEKTRLKRVKEERKLAQGLQARDLPQGQRRIVLREFNSSERIFEKVDSLTDNINVGRRLIEAGYYGPLLAAVSECRKQQGSFIVMDCPSGAGKTLAGISLRLYAEECPDAKLKVAHVVWASSVPMQPIYGAIHRDQEDKGMKVDKFYARAEEALRDPAHSGLSAVWESLLTEVFGVYDKAQTMVLFLDEVPLQPHDLHFVGEIRDALKKFVVVILAGTNSKAANMIGLTTGAVSACSPSVDNLRWSFLCTRLPRFDLDYSLLKGEWTELETHARDRPWISDVLRTIRSSIDGNGNPRLIVFAIITLWCLRNVEGSINTQVLYSRWQAGFAQMNLKSKFAFDSCSRGFRVLIAQANLLLEASADHTKSDILISDHYAQRAVPDDGKKFGTDATSSLADCGGWLCIARIKQQVLGQSLYFVAQDGSPVWDWQVTIFQSAKQDVLLYLGSTWSTGFFSFSGLAEPFTAIEVMQALWSADSFGKVNFQNVRATVNTGSYLEVLLTLATFNAAAVHKSPKTKLSEYLLQLFRQMGVKQPSQIILKDPALNGLFVPRFLFPGICPCAVPCDSYGRVYRPQNSFNYDLLLCGICGKNSRSTNHCIRFEAKYLDKCPSSLIAEIAKKIVVGEGSIGVLVVRNCPNYWTGETQLENNREALQTALQEKQTHVGLVYLVHHSGKVKVLTISQSRSARLYVVQIPD